MFIKFLTEKAAIEHAVKMQSAYIQKSGQPWVLITTIPTYDGQFATKEMVDLVHTGIEAVSIAPAVEVEEVQISEIKK